MTIPPAPDDPCSACTAPAFDAERRLFLRDAAAAVAGVLVLLGARPADALARPLDFVTPLDVLGETAPGETAPGETAPGETALGETASGETVRYPLPAADGATIDRAHDVILARWQGRVYAFSLACPHRNTALRWLAADARFQCPKHKSKYRPDGSFISGRATRGMDRFAIARDADVVVVDLAVVHRETDDRARWSAAMLVV